MCFYYLYHYIYVFLLFISLHLCVFIVYVFYDVINRTCKHGLVEVARPVTAKPARTDPSTRNSKYHMMFFMIFDVIYIRYIYNYSKVHALQ